MRFWFYVIKFLCKEIRICYDNKKLKAYWYGLLWYAIFVQSHLFMYRRVLKILKSYLYNKKKQKVHHKSVISTFILLKNHTWFCFSQQLLIIPDVCFDPTIFFRMWSHGNECQKLFDQNKWNVLN